MKIVWQFLDLNRGPLVLEATALPTEPQPLQLLSLQRQKYSDQAQIFRYFSMGHHLPLFA